MSSESSSSEPVTNALAGAASAYLRSAMHQPVQWEQWGEAAFARAVEENKPVLLDIGAVWCHWCHVMDRESYENAETAQIVNEHFVAIKVDRDERPDVDARYQAAVSAISGQGGWPLTAFLTPEGRPFFGGTYFPPTDRHGRPGLQRVLLTMAEAFRSRRDEVNDSAGSVMRAIEHSETFSGRGGTPGPELIAKLIQSATLQFDHRFGGFGSQPKFPHPPVIDLLIDAASRISIAANAELATRAREVVTVTLQRMSRGGIYDQLAGGFHRYSVDESWTVPHFEKMAYDNSGLLGNYVHAYQTFVEPDFARVAREIIAWMDTWLSDRERGGFYASQDADFSLDDDGDYFTWTRDEAADLLTPEELAVATAVFEIQEIGNMHHNPAKNVLHVAKSVGAVSDLLHQPAQVVQELLESVKAKLYAGRLRRPTPFVDKTLYTSWNAMCISAYIAAGRVLDLEGAQRFAVLSLERVLAEAWNGSTLHHVVAYGDGGRAEVGGVLDDYVFLGHALLDAWEMSADLRFYTEADALAGEMLRRFYDEAGEGFFDTERAGPGETRLGALAVRRKPLQDAPTPAGNPAAAALLLRLEALNGREEYLLRAQDTLEAFAGVAEHFGLYAATYGLAVQRMVQRPVQICILGDDAEARRLEAVALARFAVNKSVIRLRRDQLATLPPTLAETLPHLPQLQQPGAFAVVCSGTSCQPPVRTADELLELLNKSL